MLGFFDLRKIRIMRILNDSKKLGISLKKKKGVLLHRVYDIYKGSDLIGLCQIMVNDQLVKRPKRAIVTHIEVESQGGIGKIIILKLAMELALEDRILASDKKDHRPDSDYLWLSMIKRKIAFEEENYFVFMDLNELYSKKEISDFLKYYFPDSEAFNE